MQWGGGPLRVCSTLYYFEVEPIHLAHVQSCPLESMAGLAVYSGTSQATATTIFLLLFSQAFYD